MGNVSHKGPEGSADSDVAVSEKGTKSIAVFILSVDAFFHEN